MAVTAQATHTYTDTHWHTLTHTHTHTQCLACQCDLKVTGHNAGMLVILGTRGKSSSQISPGSQNWTPTTCATGFTSEKTVWELPLAFNSTPLHLTTTPPVEIIKIIIIIHLLYTILVTSYNRMAFKMVPYTLCIAYPEPPWSHICASFLHFSLYQSPSYYGLASAKLVLPILYIHKPINWAYQTSHQANCIASSPHPTRLGSMG